jgi:hypothetical protein
MRRMFATRWRGLIRSGASLIAERDLAFANLQKAASHFDIQMQEADWHQFGS